MAGLAKGDTQPFGEVITDDFVWRSMAVEGAWRIAAKGRAAVREYFAALYEQFAGRQTTVPEHIFADGETVIVEARGGGVMTKRGERYANNYCRRSHGGWKACRSSRVYGHRLRRRPARSAARERLTWSAL